MAKTRTAIVRAIPSHMPHAAAPIIRVSAPRAAPKKKHHGGRRKSHGLLGGGGAQQKAIATAIAGYVLGMVDKQGTSLPTVPMLGRAGTVAVAALFLGKGQGLWGDVALAAAAIAGYEMGSTGKISGDGVMGIVPQVSGVVPQVSGAIAAQT